VYNASVAVDAAAPGLARRPLMLESLSTHAERLGPDAVDRVLAIWATLNPGGGSGSGAAAATASSSTTTTLDRAAFDRGLAALGVTDRVVRSASFDAFDTDGDGTVDVREFIAGVATMFRGTPSERARMLFRVYDADNSGGISRDELQHAVASIRAAAGQIVDAAVAAQVDAIFAQVDADHNGVWTLDEFTTAINGKVLAPLVGDALGGGEAK
jgi:Ca2+-binding EF-hand superfamily protein